MKIAELPDFWKKKKARDEKTQEFEMTVTLEDAARLKALAEIYPDHSEEELLSDLISAALQDLPDPETRH